MHLAIPLVVLASTAVYSLGRPKPLDGSEVPEPPKAPPEKKKDSDYPSVRELYMNSYMAGLYLPHVLEYEDSSAVTEDWLNQEINHINEFEDDNPPVEDHNDDGQVRDIIRSDPFILEKFGRPLVVETRVNPQPHNMFKHRSKNLNNVKPIEPPMEVETEREADITKNEDKNNDLKIDERSSFALTPRDKGYFDQETNQPEDSGSSQDKPVLEASDERLAQRPIRQNPNLGKTRNLVAEDLPILRAGLAQNSVSTEKSEDVTKSSSGTNNMFGVAIVIFSCVGGAIMLIGFGIAFWRMARRAKAAADVDYPAYGVTGPTVDASGDRKLAHSAHMYHYQHQKQQIIAMERNGMEGHEGSISDPESEEDNEEGDYTVYECPGFATTGDMEVKNPLFAEEPTPATPGKCEIVKPQPKE